MNWAVWYYVVNFIEYFLTYQHYLVLGFNHSAVEYSSQNIFNCELCIKYSNYIFHLLSLPIVLGVLAQTWMKMRWPTPYLPLTYESGFPGVRVISGPTTQETPKYWEQHIRKLCKDTTIIISSSLPPPKTRLVTEGNWKIMWERSRPTLPHEIIYVALLLRSPLAVSPAVGRPTFKRELIQKSPQIRLTLNKNPLSAFFQIAKFYFLNKWLK